MDTITTGATRREWLGLAKDLGAGSTQQLWILDSGFLGASPQTPTH